jgi:tRNA A37 methylthiotransferase MiaB
MAEPAKRFFIHTLGCPKNQVDSDKIVGTLLDDGMEPVNSADAADLIVINTCAFIEEAREESINTILAPRSTKAFAVETKVYDGIIISSPSLISRSIAVT